LPDRSLVKVDIGDGERPDFIPCPLRGDNCALEVMLREMYAAYWKEQERINRQSWLKASGIGERYWQATREGIRESADVICDYLDHISERLNAGEGLILAGPTGTGKSAVMSLIVKACYGHARSCKYITVSRLMRLLVDRSRSHSDDSDESEYPNWSLLLIDEFGAAYEHDYVFSAFEDYLGWRYDNKLATCIATNLGPAQLKESPNYERILDRWRETCDVIVMGGKSLRQRD
jgi:DNA replication protein DnaC